MTKTNTDVCKLRPRERLIFACERFDLSFAKAEVSSIREMWTAGISLPDIAADMKRNQVEIAVLIMDLAENAIIGMREQGIFGGEESRADCKGRAKHG
jgi:hypothetical protein